MNCSTLSILLPAYNEASRIVRCIEEVVSYFSTTSISFEIIVMDDGSSDNTFQRAQNVTHPCVFVHQSPANEGKGRALQRAFTFAKGEWILFLDADLDIHPSQFLPLWQQVQKTGAQVAIGSKQNAIHRTGYPAYRQTMSRSYSLIIQTLFKFPFQDTQTGIKLFHRSVLDSVFKDVQVHGYAFDLELLARIHNNGFEIAEVPVKIQYGKKQLHITPQMILRMLGDTMSIFWRIRFLER
ncbi:MAG: glycosyltransferase [Deltaproteobacteria bacterium]|nr:glycosyltransferase [Deltaproteobacteria bacterium]